ncbi:MAG: hypothetical protein FJ146_14240 [Deltaproteobacteria bacterium]|nr:hypothetical protein [Deltaproteobacteria bacterium]
MTDPIIRQLKIDLDLGRRAVHVFNQSTIKSESLLKEAGKRQLTDDERESLEALTSRYGRALDFLTQKLMRTIDRIELTDDGSVLDRINRFKKRRILRDEINYALLKDLRNQIVHEYIIDETDRVVTEVLNFAPLLIEMFAKAEEYCRAKGFIS